MENFRKNKKLLRTILCLATALALVFTSCANLVLLRAYASDDEDTYAGIFETTAVTISNNQFESSSGTFPKSPSSWNGMSLDTNAGEIISGVVDLTSESYSLNSKSYKLTEYPEYKDGIVPMTPFGRAFKPNGTFPYYEGTNKSALLINTDGISTAYKYTSSSFSLSANSFYRIGAWVKTSDFFDAQESGAAIKLTGIDDEDIGFNNINTVKDLPRNSAGIPILTLDDNNFGWQEYVIYVSTDYRSQSVSLNLQIGDLGEDYYYPTRGYAFFDNITAFEIAPETFEAQTKASSANICVANLNTDEYITLNEEDGTPSAQNIEIGSFTHFGNNNIPLGWTSVDEDEVGGAQISILNPKTYVGKSDFFISSNPSAPLGIEKSERNNILVISAFDGRNYKSVAAGLKSTNILIERNRYYRVAAWVKAQDTTGAGATIAIKGENTIFDSELNVVKTNALGNEQNASRYGWAQHAFYIKGSSVVDCLVHVELWLGQLGNTSRGVAMFDDVTIETITEKQYNDNVSSGTEVKFDNDLSDFTGISNGKFYVAGSYEDYIYPLAPSAWTFYDAVSAGTTGYSTTAVNTDNIKSGIMPVDREHFNQNRQNYLGAGNPLPNETTPRNVLFLASIEQTAFCYRSSDISVSSEVITKVYVELMTQSINGYGASLVLKNGSNIISTIENIDTNGTFKTFDFYVSGHSSNTTTLTLEIWLGLGDRVNNRSKLSSGYVFVKEAGLADDTRFDTFDSYIEGYKNADGANIADLSNNYFINYDRYSPSLLKQAYNWNLDTSANAAADPSRTKYGIINYDEFFPIRDNQSFLPSDFKLDDSGNRNIFFMQNTSANAATATFNTNYTLTEGKYYEVSVSMKVDIPTEFIEENPDAVGAGLLLRGTDYAFTDIKDSRSYSTVYNVETKQDEQRLVDNDFKTYTFYVRVSDDMPASISFEVSLGGFDSLLEFCLGRVYVGSVNIEEITKTLYEESIEGLDEDDPYFINADLTPEEDETATEEPDESEEDDESGSSWWSKNWYVIPSIIFGLAIIVALVAVAIRKFIERRPRKARKVKRKLSRREVLEREGVVENKESEEFTEISYDEFDDDVSEVRDLKKEAKPSKQASEPIEVKAEEVDDQPTKQEETTKPSEIEEIIEEEQVEPQEEAPKYNEFDE